MKTFIKIIASAMFVLVFLFACSCTVFVPLQNQDNGKHNGWYKNPNNHYSHYSEKKNGHENKRYKEHKERK
jgi:ABC-type multidrug transport system permease subunit